MWTHEPNENLLGRHRARPSSTRAPAKWSSTVTRTSAPRRATRSSKCWRAALSPTPWCRCAACSSATPRSACARSATASPWPTTCRPRSATPLVASRHSPSASPARSSPCAPSTPAASPVPTTHGLPRVVELFEAREPRRGAHRRGVGPREHRRHRARLQGHHHPRRGCGQGVRHRRAPHARAGRRWRPGWRGHAAHPRLAIPGRAPQARRRHGHPALPRRRGAGGVSVTGRRDQRQTHRARSSAR